MFVYESVPGTAAEHFKDDFMYKIRSAIKDALVRKDELNRIISAWISARTSISLSLRKTKVRTDDSIGCLWMTHWISIRLS